MEENRKRLKKGDENLKSIKKIVVLSWESTANFFSTNFSFYTFLLSFSYQIRAPPTKLKRINSVLSEVRFLKNTYLVRVINSDNKAHLEEISVHEWRQILAANKELPKEERRYFIVNIIPTADGADRMFIEVPYEEYKTWDSERTVQREKNKYRRLYQHFSLEQSFDRNDEHAEDWLLAAQESVEYRVESDMATESLLKALALWQPWAVDLYYAYISGRKYQCNRELAEKYHVSERTIRNYKERFEAFVKNFLKKF